GPLRRTSSFPLSFCSRLIHKIDVGWRDDRFASDIPFVINIFSGRLPDGILNEESCGDRKECEAEPEPLAWRDTSQRTFDRAPDFSSPPLQRRLHLLDPIAHAVCVADVSLRTLFPIRSVSGR